MQIIPAIIPKSLEDLKSHLGQVRGLVQTVQIDVVDGKFVPNQAWPYHNSGYSDDFLAILKEAGGLPFWEELDFEADLMVADPTEAAQKWIQAGAKGLVIHEASLPETPEASGRLADLILTLRREFPRVISDTPVSVEIGLAVMSGDAQANAALLKRIAPLANELDFIQCMGIAKIGFQGQPFDQRVLETIKAIRAAYPEMPISVDGGVTFETAPLLRDAGATRLVSGSTIFESNDTRSTIEAFEGL